MTDSKVFIDSSVWLAYFLASSEKSRDYIDSPENTLYTSVITLHEVANKLHSLRYSPQQTGKVLKFIRENSILVQVDEPIALLSVQHTTNKRLHTVDALIYESARQNGCTLITADYDFKGLENTLIIQ